MKRIIFLCGCIAAFLMLCVADGSRQRRRTLETAVQRIQDAERDIRVLIKTAGFASEYHESVTVWTAAGFTVSDGSQSWTYPAGEDAVFTAGTEHFTGHDTLFLKAQDGRFTVKNLQRDRSGEIYEGNLELHSVPDGLLLINELPLEQYLCGVVPSEMPASYPAEALKAQAVCARTYARKRMEEQSASEWYADVDDSVSYQVYNNQDRSDEADAAVRETAGQVLENEQGLIEAMYYSTSCGLDTGLDLSQEALFAAAIAEDHIRAYEAEEPWYRWSTDILLENLPGTAAVEVSGRRKDGAAQTLAVTEQDGTQYVVEGEYGIREFLAGAHPTVTLQDGEARGELALLPSAFFVMQPLYEGGRLYGYHLLGGGYGHGVGLSQNGAKHMAMEGMDYREILRHYYGADVNIV